MSDVIVRSLTDFELSLYFHPETYLRSARHTVDQREINEVNWQKGEGPVWQTSDRSEAVVFGFKLRAGGGWQLLTQCARCRTDGCAHVVALGRTILASQRSVLVAWQQRADLMAPRRIIDWERRLPPIPAPPTPEQAFQSWLAKRQKAAELRPTAMDRPGEPTSTSTEDLIFLVKSNPLRRRLALEAGTSRKLKGKELMTKPYLFSEHTPDRPEEQFMAHPMYRRYAAWCVSNFAGMDSHTRWSCEVLDEAGVELVQAVAGAGLLFVYDTDQDRPVGPAQWGAPRPLVWEWAEPAPNLLELKPSVDGGGDFYFGPVPMYADSRARSVGPLELCGMESADAETACGAPAIPKEWVKANVHSAQAVRFLPRPPEHIVRRSNRVIAGVVPIPVITVEVKDRKDIYALGLAFRYADDVIEYFDPTLERIQFLHRGDDTIEVVRDRQAESTAHKAMAAVGLARTPAGDWRFAGDRSRQLVGFRELITSDFAQLRSAGFEIRQVGGWSDRVQQAETVVGGFGGLGAASVLGNERPEGTPGLEFSMGFVMNGERLNLLPLVSQIVEGLGGIEGINQLSGASTADTPDVPGSNTLWVLDEDGRWIGLPKRELAPWLSIMAELLSGRRAKEMASPTIRLSRIEALRMEAQSPELQLGGQGAQIITELLAAKQCVDELDIKGFEATLQPFQRTGVHWMRVLAKYSLGGLLGDDRGLGKTVQCLAHLQDIKSRGGLRNPALVVAIATQITHWERHLRCMTPELRVIVLGGTERFELLESLSQYDVVVTSWGKVTLDIEALARQRFEVGIYDETEKVHNPHTATAKALRLLNVGYGICVNGSPVENSFSDLWSVIDAALPGFLGSASVYRRTFLIPIEGEGDNDKLCQLRKRIAAFMLRRLKKDSGVTLPPVVNKDIALRIAGEQANLYEVLRITTEAKVQEALSSGSYESNRGHILRTLTKLRQVCVHPLMTEEGAGLSIDQSAKLEWLSNNLEIMVADGRRILVVCFFTQFFDILGPLLDRKGIPHSVISSRVQNREAQKQAFKSGKTRVFLLGLKSGGRGLDLPEADVVCHVDPWYNPRAHDQATDRAHRIGQVNTVLNIRLFIEGSFEERVIQIQERKRVFADSLDDPSVLDEAKITEDDVREMLKPLAEHEIETEAAAPAS